MTKKYYHFPRIHYSENNPTKDSDSTKGFLIGGTYVNTETGEKFECVDNIQGAAIWHKIVDYLDPMESTTPSAQASINAAADARNIFITPQVLFQDDVISYDLSINRNAMSAGPITIDEGYTVTLGASGVWTVI